MTCTLKWVTPFEVPHTCRRPVDHDGIHNCECGEGLWPHEVDDGPEGQGPAKPDQTETG